MYNQLKLKYASQEYVVYLYFPEGQGTPGEIRMNIGDEEATVISYAEADNSAGRFAFKATKAVKRCVEEKNLPLEFTQAWG